jgi:hypothetical protein
MAFDHQHYPPPGEACEIFPKNIMRTAPYLYIISIETPEENPNTYVAVPTKTSYTLPSATTDMIKANTRMKLADVTAIRRRDIGTRNRRKTGIKRVTMMVETSKARPRPAIPFEEKKVIRGSAIGFISSFSLRKVLK